LFVLRSTFIIFARDAKEIEPSRAKNFHIGSFVFSLYRNNGQKQ